MPATYAAAPLVRLRPTEHGAFLLDLRTRARYELNGTGLLAWRALMEGATEDETAAKLCEGRDVDFSVVRQMVVELVADLLEASLLERTGSSPAD